MVKIREISILPSLTLFLFYSYIRTSKAVNYMKAWTSYDANTTFKKSQNIISHENGFLFALCQTLTDRTTELNCNITIDRPLVQETCSIKLSSSEGSESNIKLHISNLRHFGHTVFITWLEKVTRHISVLHMLDCSISHVVRYVLNNNLLIDPVFHENGLDIFVRDKMLCPDQMDSCRISYDKKGQQTSEPTLLQLNLTEATILPIVASLAEGYFAYGMKELMLFEVKQVSSNGTVTTILTDQVMTLFVYEIQTSKTHNLFGLCWFDLDNLEIHCAQFDTSGVQTLNLTTMFLPRSEILVGVHNVDKGKMLLITKIERDDFGYNVRKIIDGKVEKPVPIGYKCLQTSSNFKMSIGETADEYIFYFAGVKNHYEDNNDFSASNLKTILRSKPGRLVQSDLIFEVTRVPKKLIDDKSI